MEVSTKGKATFQPRLQDQNVAPSLEGTVKIDIFLKSLRQNNFGVFGSSGGRTS